MGFEIVELNEPVEVVTYFADRQAKPLRFRWRGREYRVVRWNSTWSQPKGSEREHHFALTADNSDTFELVFDTGDLSWRLRRVISLQ
ncbi:MAG: hypothetical protein ONB23_07180 [candidate division KSB1 bacterium]|nr:hypothetical protein [candidate division KSB1 bacterium]